MRLPRTHVKLSLLSTLALPCFLSLLLTPAILTRRDATTARQAPATEQATTRALEAYGRTPLAFEANRGQTATEVDFLARGDGYTLFLKPSEVLLQLRKAEGGLNPRPSLPRKPSTRNRQSALRKRHCCA